MPRVSQTSAKRRALLPIVAHAFAELGYRRTTTAELARRCGVRENILYRLWPDKKAMFIAAIGYVYDQSVAIWGRLLVETDGETTLAERLLAYESQHHGEFGHYRIVFAGLSETDDPEVRAALSDMYRRFARFVEQQIKVHRASRAVGTTPGAGDTAWAVVGLGTVANIARELGLVSDTQRRRLFAEVGRLLLTGSQK
ncbi:MAG TPA: TetR/AcrR family transcriptional regulator [Phycisphaerae bacterium]|jgi:AcrR family transcriptional regulator|nr:TetR/AcrR family transcriptional regulator [Phycisphaerae bacterium]